MEDPETMADLMALIPNPGDKIITNGYEVTKIGTYKAVSIVCPRCGMTSFHPVDVAEGYCGNCRDWTTHVDA